MTAKIPSVLRLHAGATAGFYYSLPFLKVFAILGKIINFFAMYSDKRLIKNGDYIKIEKYEI